jgi:anti-anti-sigma factor
MAIEIVVENQAGLQIMRLKGRLDSMDVPTLEERFQDMLAAGSQKVIVECSDLRYVGSIGLGIFIASGKALSAKGGKLSFAGLTEHVRSVFEMVGFYSLFEVFPTLEEALSAESKPR